VTIILAIKYVPQIVIQAKNSLPIYLVVCFKLLYTVLEAAEPHFVE